MCLGRATVKAARLERCGAADNRPLSGSTENVTTVLGCSLSRIKVSPPFFRRVGSTAALAIEAAELQEALLWKSDQQTENYVEDPFGRQKVAYEIADVLTSALLFCHATGIDPIVAIGQKLEINAKSTPSNCRRVRRPSIPTCRGSKN